MATESKAASALDDAALAEIEKDVSDLERHSAVDAPSPGGRPILHGPWRWVVFVIGLTLAVFHVYTGPVFEGTLPGLRQGAFHLALGLGLVFLLYPVKERSTGSQRYFGWFLTAAGALFLVWMPIAGIAGWHVVIPAFLVLVLVQAARYLPWTLAGMPPGDLLLSALGVGCGLYLFLNYDAITRSVGRIDTDYVVVGTVGILLILVAAQRTLGSALVILASLMLAYAYYGPFMPGFLAHSGFSVDRIVSNSYLGTEAVFGTPIWISATVIFLFLIFAAMLQRTGMERFFTDAALGSTGWATGGTAKVGIATSAFSGTITGSSVANTVSNGAFTIPMMKKSGYKPEYAGAVEAASSTGGQIAPPIMGAAAFIMIEFTGVPYAEIIQAALVPAILFFVAQFVVVHFDSKKLGIRGIPKYLLPSVRRLMAAKGYLLIPIIAIFVLLFIGFSPGFAAMGAIVIAVGTNLLVQFAAPLAGVVPRRGQAAERQSTGQGSRLVGAAAILLGVAAVCAVGWGAFLAWGALAPEVETATRLIVVSVLLGALFALGARMIARWRSAPDPEQDGLRPELVGVLRLMLPLAALIGLIAAYLAVLDRVLSAVEWAAQGAVQAPVLGPAAQWLGLEAFAASDRGMQILAAVLGISLLSVLVMSLFRPWSTKVEDRLSLETILEGLVGAARIALPIIVACAAAGLIAGVITLTGLGLKLSGGLVALGEPAAAFLSWASFGLLDPGTAHLIPVMVLSMLACLILGIGLPTTANYVITATLAAPAILVILRGDLPESTTAMLLMAHMFVYYFGVMADITPPVCLAAFAASGISGGNPIQTGVQSVRIAVSGFVVPFMFVLNPALLLQEVTFVEGLSATLTGIVGACLVAVAVVGFINARISVWERLLLALAGLGLLYGSWESDVAGVAIAAVIFGLHFRRHGMTTAAPAGAGRVS